MEGTQKGAGRKVGHLHLVTLVTDGDHFMDAGVVEWLVGLILYTLGWTGLYLSRDTPHALTQHAT